MHRSGSEEEVDEEKKICCIWRRVEYWLKNRTLLEKINEEEISWWIEHH